MPADIDAMWNNQDFHHCATSTEALRAKIHSAIEDWHYAFPSPTDSVLAIVERELTTARLEGMEAAAKIVDQCNRDGPFNAIGAAKLIRAQMETGK